MDESKIKKGATVVVRFEGRDRTVVVEALDYDEGQLVSVIFQLTPGDTRGVDPDQIIRIVEAK